LLKAGAEAMGIESINLTPRIGSEIKVDRTALLKGEYTDRLRDLLEQRGVLLFRQLNLDDGEQVTFAKTLGDVIPQGEKGIYKVTLDRSVTETADYLHGTFYWHIDGAQDDVPTRASLLSARRLSEIGGETQFANTYAAYEDLPESDKRTFKKLKIAHSQEMIQRKVYPNPSEAQVRRWREHKEKLHPLVWTHRSGRKSLVLGLTASHIVGMDAQAGRALIDRLQDWATQSQFVYRHKWTIGDLIIWDNTGVMHRVTPYPADSGRMLHRTTLVGEEALV
jgi:alpha-ketoglutarate-dependent taurine dioxygenase